MRVCTYHDTCVSLFLGKLACSKRSETNSTIGCGVVFFGFIKKEDRCVQIVLHTRLWDLNLDIVVADQEGGGGEEQWRKEEKGVNV